MWAFPRACVEFPTCWRRTKVIGAAVASPPIWKGKKKKKKSSGFFAGESCSRLTSYASFLFSFFLSFPTAGPWLFCWITNSNRCLLTSRWTRSCSWKPSPTFRRFSVSILPPEVGGARGARRRCRRGHGFTLCPTCSSWQVGFELCANRTRLEAGSGARWVTVGGGSESAAAMAAYRETLCLLIEQSTHWPLCAITVRSLRFLFAPNVPDLYSPPPPSWARRRVWWKSFIFHRFALKCLVSLFFPDCLGSTVFGVIKSDINGNITVRYFDLCAFRRCSCSMQTQPKRDFSSFFLFTSRKLKRCISRTLRSTSPCRTSWRQKEKPKRRSGPKLEQH